MRLTLTDDSRVHVDVRSKGLIAALDHELTFTGHPDPFTVEVGETTPLDIAVEARVPIARLDPPPSASKFDRDKMLDNLRGRDVLDMDRTPVLCLRGRYRGELDKGELEGDLFVRGAPKHVKLPVEIVRSFDVYRVRAVWEGSQTELGIKPFRALFGALKLSDYARIRLDLTFAAEP